MASREENFGVSRDLSPTITGATPIEALPSTGARLSGDDLVFAQRMLPHFLAGKSAREAAAAVIDDDARLLMLLWEGHTHYATGMAHSFGYRAQGLRDALTLEVRTALTSLALGEG